MKNSLARRVWIVAGTLCAILMVAGADVAVAQRQDLFGEEPPAKALGAPLYPNARFLRTVSSLDPYYESVVYVTPDTPQAVNAFFAKRLRDARKVEYQEENTWITAYLLRSWIPLTDRPDREELPVLDASPNITVKEYQEDLYYRIIEYFTPRPMYAARLAALDSARTVIRYTYQNIPEDESFARILGTWRQVDRDMPRWYGSTYTFNPDSTFVLELSEANIAAMARSPRIAAIFRGKTTDEIAALLTSRNPERGRFSILRTTITFVIDEPLLGNPVETGIAEVGRSSLTLQLINRPRLTFLRRRRPDDERRTDGERRPSPDRRPPSTTPSAP